MPSRNAPESPLEAVAGGAGPPATEAFKLLGNETRLAILLALWEAYDPTAETNALSFTEIRDRVGVRQGGQFNYHLDKLVGEFVRKTDAGYHLRGTGLRLVQSIIAGTGIEDPTLEPTEIDASCDLCGAPTAITYQNGRVYQVCTDCSGGGFSGDDHPPGALIGWTFEPTGLADRSPEEVFTASTIKSFGRIVMRFEGVCPECSGPVEWSLDVCDDHDNTETDTCSNCGRDDPILAREVCRVCKSSGWGSPSIKVLFHPAVIAFFYDHGIEVGFTGTIGYTDVIQALDLVSGFEEEIVSGDPLRVSVTISHGTEELRLVLDEEMNVVDVTEQ